MTWQPYRALRIVLRVESGYQVIYGFLMFFGKHAAPENGGVLLLLGILLWFAARDPLRNIAIIDGFIIGCCILSFTAILPLWRPPVHTPPFHSSYFWVLSLVRLMLAALLYWLRPKEAWQPPQANMLGTVPE
jgi:hypothetical protein